MNNVLDKRSKIGDNKHMMVEENQTQAASKLQRILQEDQNHTKTWKNVSKAVQAANQARQQASQAQKKEVKSTADNA